MTDLERALVKEVGEEQAKRLVRVLAVHTVGEGIPSLLDDLDTEIVAMADELREGKFADIAKRIQQSFHDQVERIKAMPLSAKVDGVIKFTRTL